MLTRLVFTTAATVTTVATAATVTTITTLRPAGDQSGNKWRDWRRSTDTHSRTPPGAVVELVEHGPRVREIVGSNPRSSQTNDL